MARYFLFDENGDCILEAPSTKCNNGRVIIGYNTPTNEEMLFNDGFRRYDGFKDMAHLKLVDGEIVEVEPEPEPIDKTVFTKLQIRRAMRKMGIEEQLDAIISGDNEIARDWNDAQVIDLNDEVLRTALSEYDITDEFIDAIIANIEE